MTTQSDDVFGKEEEVKSQESTQTPESVSVPDALVDKLKAIKNERGEQKYGDVSTALDALLASQEYIPSLKSQLEEKDGEIQKWKELAERATSVDDLVSRLTSQEKPQETPVSSFGEQEAAALFEQLLQQSAKANAEVENVKAVNATLLAQYGSAEAAQQATKEKAASLNVTVEQLKEMAGKNPNLVLALFPEPKPTPKASNLQGVNTAGFMKGRDVPQGVSKPEKSLLVGASYKDQLDYLHAIRHEVYKKNGIE